MMILHANSLHTTAKQTLLGCLSFTYTFCYRLGIYVLLISLWIFSPSANAAQVNLLNSTSTSTTGAGAAGTPNLSTFNIPAGKNRVLFIFAAFERDHCDQAMDTCLLNLPTSGVAGLSDNYSRVSATNQQITAQVIGTGGTINRQNALTIGGIPSGDTRFSWIEATLKDSANVPIPNSTLFSGDSYHIALFENDINTLLGGVSTGNVSISLPDMPNPKNAGDDALLMAFVLENVEQAVSGFVRSALPQLNTAGGIAGNYALSAPNFDAGQAPNDANDGLLVVGVSTLGQPSSTGGFLTMSGYTQVQSLTTTNINGRYDNSEPTWVTSEPDGFSASAQFRNGIVSSYTLQSAASSALVTVGGWAPGFTISSDNADISDAPTSYGNPTHAISGIRLGASVDADAAILANATASGDDTNGSDDENGVTMPAALTASVVALVPVSIQNASGYLNAWFDWNLDGDFLDSGEQVTTDQAVAIGTTNLSITPPANAANGTSFARFRVCTSTALCNTPTSTASSGEVEDYTINVIGLTKDYSDAPSTYDTPNHTIVAGIHLGANAPDSETAQPTPLDGTGDDTTGTDDEDGITLPTLTQNQAATITATVAGAGGYLQGWIDWNGDGDFADAGEQVATNLQDGGGLDTDGTAGTVAFAVNVPATAITTQTYARFRWSTTSGLNTTTAASNGEVEDYALTINLASSACTTGAWSTWTGFTNNTTFTNAEGMTITRVSGSSLAGSVSGAGTVWQYVAGATLPVQNGLGFNIPHYPNTTTFDITWPTLQTPSLAVAAASNVFGNPDANASSVNFDFYDQDNQLIPGKFYSNYRPFAGQPLATYSGHSMIGATQFAMDSSTLAMQPSVLTGYVGISKVRVTFIPATNVTGTYDAVGLYIFAPCAASTSFYDYGDAPISGTAPNGSSTNTYGEAKHTLVNSMYLGAATPDADASNQASADAGSNSSSGDDGDGNDDEDGITLPTLTQNQAATITATVAGAGGYLQGWIDWNGDGDFADAGEQIATNLQDGGGLDTNASAGTISFAVSVPANAVTTPTYARFRWSTASGLNTTTAASDGEVEDYLITIKPKPFSTCPAETFITLGSSASTIDLYALDLVSGAMNLLGSNTVLQNSANAIGFRQQDGYLWGWNNKAGSIGLMRIGVNGIADMPYGTTQPTGFPVNKTIYRGDISSAGIYSVVQFGTSQLWHIDVDTNAVIGSPVTLSAAVGTDIAYHPVDGFLYAVSDTTGTLQRINPTSGVVTNLPLTLPINTGWGAVVFDQTGTLYAYNGTSGGVYRVFNVDGTGIMAYDLLTTSSAAANLDGARCVNAPVQGGPAVRITATTVGGVAGPFTFTLNQAVQTTGTGTTVTDNVPVAIDGNSSITGVQAFTIPVANIGQALIIEESSLPTGWELSSATCQVDGTPVGSLSGSDYTVPASAVAAGALIECNFSHSISYDYSDALASYGTPTHAIVTGIHLGTNPPDADTAANPTTNANGDDTTGIDDEDGVTLPTEFVPNQIATVSVNVTGSGGRLQAWIDWNGDGDFADAGEPVAKNLADNAGIDTDATAGVITFNVTPPTTATVGNGYARFRWSTQSNLTATAAANDGEVEDYAVTIGANGTTLSIAGRVFNDANVNGMDNTEAGLKDVTVVLFDSTSNTCQSTHTNAKGEYQFLDLVAGDYEVFEAANAKVPTPSTCPPAVKDPNGFVSSTPNNLVITLSTAAVNDADFGDARAPTFSLDNSKVILPNSTVTYPHIFQTYADGNVLFSLSNTADPANLNWGATLFLDNDCDAKLGSGDTPITSALAVNAGTKLCILTKVAAPANAPTGALHVLTITSDFQYGDASLIPASNIQTHTDRTQTSAGTNTEDPTKPISGEGKLSLEKSVWNVTHNSDGSVALPSETLRYTIYYENIGNGLLNELAIQDAVPEFTQLVPASMLCGTTPPELSACTPQANGNSLTWSFTGQLKAGSKGEVSYEVLIE